NADFVYTPKAAPKMRTFNLNCDVTLPGRESRARLYFDFQDIRNHHYVDFTSDAVEIVAVRGDAAGDAPPVGRVLSRVRHLSLPVGEPLHVSIKRRKLAIRVVIDDGVVAEAYDETCQGGQAGYASLPDDAAFENLTVQSVADVYFADDFMRTDEEKGVWTELRGNWQVSSLTHPSMSANAFQYAARTGGDSEGAVVTGHPFWDDYAFEVSVKPQREAPFGLYFYYRDENNYFRFEWHPDTTEPQSEEDQKNKVEPKVIAGSKQLVRMWHGERTVLATRPGGFKLNQWYAVKCVVSGPLTRTTIDENLVFEHRDDRLVSGMVGLFVGQNSRTFFDDVFVRSYKHFEDGFTHGGENAWLMMGGRWKRVPLGRAETPNAPTGGAAAPLAGVLSVSTPHGEARAAVGSANWKNYVLETEIHPDDVGRTGVVLYYQDETRYYQASRRAEDDGRETWTLERVLDGERLVLDERSLSAPAGSRKVAAGVDNGYLWVTVDGQKVLEAFDTKLVSGAAGLFAADLERAQFGPVRVDWPLREAPLLTLNEVFEQEISMGNWSSVESEWEWDTSTGLLVHKGNWPGDAEITLSVDATRRPDVGLLLSGDEKKPGNGYLLKFAPVKGEDTKQMTLVILRAGKPLDGDVLDIRTGERAAGPLTLTGDVEQVGFRRIGSTLIGYVNRQAVLAQRDPEPLRGDVIGWYDPRARDANRSKRDVLKSLVSVSSPNVHKYLFRRAYTDWRVVNGVWEITSRWQCDPRWTFFSGRTSWKLAAIWNKRKLRGDTTLDFFIGPKMDRDRGGRYEYVADFNCTLAANGIDLDSGYSFLFGGFNNSKTVLVRKDKVVAEAKWPVTEGYMRQGQPVIIPIGGIHRQWFRVKAQKKDARLRLWIDDALVIDYTDPDPLTGDRVALWTWNNGIMVARVTVSADALGEYESPDAYTPSQCRCLYDDPAVAGR
ncbi:MAG TPA: hypothetical protein VMY39_09080, partial [Planctomycetota bacterium]|nr:hypothetical protein [Planctomycetota bacterium]